MAKDAHTLDYVVRSAIAGGGAGCAAKTLIAPLDRVKILFQTGQPQFTRFAGTPLGLPKAAAYICRTEGPMGLFRGHSATLVRIFPYSAIKFVAYEQIRAWLIPAKAQETHLRRFMAGSLAGIASVLCTYPLDVVRVRLAYTGSQPSVQHGRHRLYRTIRDMWDLKGNKMLETAANSDIKKGKGTSKILARIRTFFPGFGPTLLGVVPYAGVSFFAHDIGHDIFRSWMLAPIAVQPISPGDTRRAPLKAWAELVAGGTSGIVAQTAAYPLEVIRRRMQVGSLQGSRDSLVQTAKAIYREAGIRGFFVGLTIGYIKVGPMFACSFYVYEQMKFWLHI